MAVEWKNLRDPHGVTHRAVGPWTAKCGMAGELKTTKDEADCHRCLGEKRKPTGLSRSQSQMQRTRLKQRTFTERKNDKPDVYGPIFEEIKLMPCWGVGRVYAHTCFGRHTMHHDPPVGRGGTDLTGGVPVCGKLHAFLDNRSSYMTRSELLASVGVSEEAFRQTCLWYVEQAKASLRRKHLSY